MIRTAINCIWDKVRCKYPLHHLQVWRNKSSMTSCEDRSAAARLGCWWEPRNRIPIRLGPTHCSWFRPGRRGGPRRRKRAPARWFVARGPFWRWGKWFLVLAGKSAKLEMWRSEIGEKEKLFVVQKLVRVKKILFFIW